MTMEEYSAYSKMISLDEYEKRFAMYSGSIIQTQVMRTSDLSESSLMRMVEDERKEQRRMVHPSIDIRGGEKYHENIRNIDYIAEERCKVISLVCSENFNSSKLIEKIKAFLNGNLDAVEVIKYQKYIEDPFIIAILLRKLNGADLEEYKKIINNVDLVVNEKRTKKRHNHFVNSVKNLRKSIDMEIESRLREYEWNRFEPNGRLNFELAKERYAKVREHLDTFFDAFESPSVSDGVYSDKLFSAYGAVCRALEDLNYCKSMNKMFLEFLKNWELFDDFKQQMALPKDKRRNGPILKSVSREDIIVENQEIIVSDKGNVEEVETTSSVNDVEEELLPDMQVSEEVVSDTQADALAKFEEEKDIQRKKDSEDAKYIIFKVEEDGRVVPVSSDDYDVVPRGKK